ncbi:MAG: Fe-S cluster assembly protein SufD [Jatrophihabitans sp.]|nr:MAG: Fe-S cluster assembly protein SufD [Jatrophihabitans sp.]
MTLSQLVNERATTGTPPNRFRSRNPDDFAVPRGREEEWRFTPVRQVRELFEPFAPTSVMDGSVDAPDGVTWAIVAPDDARVGQVLQPGDRVSALAFSHARQALVLELTGTPERPVLVHGRITPGLAYEHMVIEAKPHARATVVVDYAGSATVAENVEIVVGAGAHLTVVSLQQWDADAVHLSSHAIRLGADATVKHVVVNLTGRLVRIAPTVEFAGRGARAEMLGVGFAGDGHHFESRLYLDHAVPHCTSDVLYKNVLSGESARTVWIGDVRIRPAAAGTSTYEMNRNLLLTDGARADSVPNLEIETGDIIGAGHASATGRFDDLQLFYLQSRGIPFEEAQRLVVRGFLADVVDRIGVPDLQERVMTAIEARLGFTPEVENED